MADGPEGALTQLVQLLMIYVLLCIKKTRLSAKYLILNLCFKGNVKAYRISFSVHGTLQLKFVKLWTVL